jgi:hypothetical protein
MCSEKEAPAGRHVTRFPGDNTVSGTVGGDKHFRRFFYSTHSHKLDD